QQRRQRGWQLLSDPLKDGITDNRQHRAKQDGDQKRRHHVKEQNGNTQAEKNLNPSFPRLIGLLHLRNIACTHELSYTFSVTVPPLFTTPDPSSKALAIF